MVKRRGLRGPVLMLMCGVLLVAAVRQTPVALADGASSYQSEIDRLNTQMDQLESQKSEIEKQLGVTQDAREEEMGRKQYLDRQIEITREEIAVLEERIVVVEGQIQRKQLEMGETQASIDENYTLFQKRMRAMYIQDDATVLGLILGADSFSDFLTRTEVAVRIAQHDRSLIATLREEYDALEAARVDLEEAKTLLDEDKAATEGKKQELAGQLGEAEKSIQDMESMEAQFQADLEAMQAQMEQMQRELDDIYRQIEWDKSPYVGGEMAWPLPGYSNISSPYGTRFGGADFHTGMDISGSGVYGAPIVAANNGTVKFVNWSYTPGRDYGIYLIVDHGGGVTTLYAHCSNIVVNVGDTVERGQKIAEVGSTGWSTGPHLHFEVRIDGAHVNPKPYVTG